MSKKPHHIGIEITGLNLARLVDCMRREGVTLHNIVRGDSKKTTFFVSVFEYKKCVAILSKMCYNYVVKSPTALKAALDYSLARLGLVIALLIFSALTALSNAFIWRIQIDGLENVPKNAVESILKDSKIRSGIFQNQVELSSLKKRVVELDGVVDAAVYFRGTTLCVVVFEQMVQDVPIAADGLIISSFDAVVTRINVIEGTAVVGVGSVVKKGDELIAPYVLDTNGEMLKDVVPNGEVFGKVTFNASKFFALEQTVYAESGRTQTLTSIDFFGFRIGGGKCSFKLFYTERSTEVLGRNMFLPIKTETRIFRELKAVKKTYTLDERRDTLARQLEETLLFNARGNVTKREVTVREVAGGYRLDLFIEADIKLN